jgi:hypothetical protein
MNADGQRDVGRLRVGVGNGGQHGKIEAHARFVFVRTYLRNTEIFF